MTNVNLVKMVKTSSPCRIASTGFPDSPSLVIRLYHVSLPAGTLNYILCLYRAVLVGCPTFARLCEGVHEKKSLMSWSLLIQLCPACLVRLIWIVLEMGGRWTYSCCFVGCCFQDLFNMARSILVQFPSSFFLYTLSVQVVHSYSSIDTTAAWKNCFSFYRTGLC